MSDCSKHKKEVAGISDMKVLAEMIGDLHYESLEELCYWLQQKIYTDARKDFNAGRKELGFALLDAAVDLHRVHSHIKNAWQISKPFMDKNNN